MSDPFGPPGTPTSSSSAPSTPASTSTTSPTAAPTEVREPTPPARAPSGNGPAARQPAPAHHGRAPRSRHARVVLRKIGPWSVLKISFLFYLCVMAVIMGALVILYGLLGALGALDSLQRLIRDLFAEPSFTINGDWLFTRGLAIGFGMVVLWTLINVFVVFLYNLLSDIVGGIEVTLSERR